MGRQTLFQGGHRDQSRDPAMGLRSAGERLGRAPNTTRERGDLAKEQGGVSG